MKSFLLLAWLLGTISIQATPVVDKLQVLKAALKESLAGKSDSDEKIANEKSIAAQLDALDLSGTQAPDQSEIFAQQLINQGVSGPTLNAALELIAAIEADVKIRKADSDAKFDAIIAQAAALIPSAQDPKALDEVLHDLHALSSESPNSPSLSVMFAKGDNSNRINEVIQFVSQWQDYLSEKLAGNMEVAQNALRGLLNNHYPDASEILPRSSILAALRDLEKNPVPQPTPDQDTNESLARVDEVVAQIKTLDQIDSLASKLNALPPSPYGRDISGILFNMEAIYNDAKAGLPATLAWSKVGFGEQKSTSEALSSLKAKLVLYAIPRVLHASADQQPQPNELLADYLDRMELAAETAHDWQLLQRIVSIRVSLQLPGDEPGTSGTQIFLAALSQEAAHQYTLAVQSYENALKSPDTILPVTFVGSRLDEIKKEHPDDFARAEKLILTPPLPIDPRMMNAQFNPLASYLGQFRSGRALPVNMVYQIPDSVTLAPSVPSTNSTSAPAGR